MITETPVGSLMKRDSKNVQTSYLTHIWYNFQYTSVRELSKCRSYILRRDIEAEGDVQNRSIFRQKTSDALSLSMPFPPTGHKTGCRAHSSGPNGPLPDHLAVLGVLNPPVNSYPLDHVVIHGEEPYLYC